MDGGAHKAIAHRGLGGGEQPPSESVNADIEEADAMIGRRGWCCIWGPRFGSGRSVRGGEWERIGDGSPAGTPGDAWWRRALMRVREWSEIVAGPRWKTFIRQFKRKSRWVGGGAGGSGGTSGLCGIGGGGARSGKFQYDPMSYSLNFDEGNNPDSDSDGGGYGYRNFSARYVLPPTLIKVPVDAGTPPPFTVT